MPATASLVGAGLEGAKIISSAINLKKDKEEVAKLHRPFYKVQDEYLRNQALAENLAQSGFTQSTKDFFTSGTERGIGSSLGALLRAGGSPNDVSALLDVYGRTVSSFAAEEGNRHIQNIQYLTNTNKDLAGQKTMAWAINEYQPYQAKLKELTERRSADTQNLWSGMEGVVGAAGAYGTAQMNNKLLDSLSGNAKLMNKLFGDGNGSISEPHGTMNFPGEVEAARETPVNVPDFK